MPYPGIYKCLKFVWAHLSKEALYPYLNWMGGWGRTGTANKACWPSLSPSDLWEGNNELWVAVILTVSDSLPLGTSVLVALERPLFFSHWWLCGALRGLLATVLLPGLSLPGEAGSCPGSRWHFSLGLNLASTSLVQNRTHI